MVLGGYLPWFRHNPDYQGVGIMLIPQTSPGFEWVDSILLVPVALLVAYLTVQEPTKWWARVTGVIGLVTVILPLLLAWSQYFYHDAHYIPDVGLAFTVLGGVLLLGASGYDRYTAD